MVSNSSDAQSPDQLGLLGAQILLALAAYQRPDERHHCRVRDEDFAGSDLLTGNGRKFLVYDSLPGDIHNKAIGVDQKTLFIELTPFDEERVEEFAPLPQGVILKDQAMWRGKRKLATYIRSSAEVREEHGDRALWMIRQSALSDEDLRAAIACLDHLDQEGVYLQGASEPAPASGLSLGSSGSVGGQRLELRLGLQMDLIQAQVPVLALSAQMKNEQRMSLEIAQMLRFERLLQCNPEEAIQRSLEEDASPAGQETLANFIIFAMARRVKEAAASVGKDVSWSNARRVVRDLMKKG